MSFTPLSNFFSTFVLSSETKKSEYLPWALPCYTDLQCRHIPNWNIYIYTSLEQPIVPIQTLFLNHICSQPSVTSNGGHLHKEVGLGRTVYYLSYCSTPQDLVDSLSRYD